MPARLTSASAGSRPWAVERAADGGVARDVSMHAPAAKNWCTACDASPLCSFLARALLGRRGKQGRVGKAAAPSTCEWHTSRDWASRRRSVKNLKVGLRLGWLG